MSILRQAAQQALEALEGLADYRYTDRVKNTMASLRQALAEPEQKAKPITSAEMSAWVKDTWEKCQAEAWQEPSGSFVLWENTLCNPLSDPRSMAHSAWHDGHASGVKAEREECAKVCEGINDGTPYNLAAECAAAIRSRT